MINCKPRQEHGGDAQRGIKMDNGKKQFFSKIWQKIRNFNIQDCRVSFVNGMESLQANGKALFVTVILAVIVMLLVCLAVFFGTVRSPEKVLVPQVEGKDLTQALLEMQVKELYPKIQLRYDEQPSGTVLAQSPDAGAIVKGGTRVNLTVSRGAIVSEVGNYIGKKYDDLKIDLTTMFTGSRALIVLADPVYKASVEDPGTILEQDPPEGTKISEPVTLNVIVSSGPNFENTAVPHFIGRSVKEMLAMLPNLRVVLDFTAHKAASGEKEDAVVSQQTFEEKYIPKYTRMTVDMAFPVKPENDLIYGIFETELAQFPYPVAMTVECIESNGQRYQLASLDHTGGHFSIPYAVSEGSELILRVADKIAERITVNN